LVYFSAGQKILFGFEMLMVFCGCFRAAVASGTGGSTGTAGAAMASLGAAARGGGAPSTIQP